MHHSFLAPRAYLCSTSLKVTLIDMMLKTLKNKLLWYVVLDYFRTRPSFKKFEHIFFDQATIDAKSLLMFEIRQLVAQLILDMIPKHKKIKPKYFLKYIDPLHSFLYLQGASMKSTTQGIFHQQKTLIL